MPVPVPVSRFVTDREFEPRGREPSPSGSSRRRRRGRVVGPSEKRTSTRRRRGSNPRPRTPVERSSLVRSVLVHLSDFRGGVTVAYHRRKRGRVGSRVGGGFGSGGPQRVDGWRRRRRRRGALAPAVYAGGVGREGAVLEGRRAGGSESERCPRERRLAGLKAGLHIRRESSGPPVVRLGSRLDPAFEIAPREREVVQGRGGSIGGGGRVRAETFGLVEVGLGQLPRGRTLGGLGSSAVEIDVAVYREREVAPRGLERTPGLRFPSARHRTELQHVGVRKRRRRRRPLAAASALRRHRRRAPSRLPPGGWGATGCRPRAGRLDRFTFFSAAPDG